MNEFCEKGQQFRSHSGKMNVVMRVVVKIKVFENKFIQNSFGNGRLVGKLPITVNVD